MDYLEINRRTYEESAREYAYRVSWYEKEDKKILEPFISIMKNKFAEPKVLELGPGSGLALKFFESAGIKTKAIDFSKKILDVAKENSPKTEFIEGDFLSYNFLNEKFDGIFAKAFIHLFPLDDVLRVFDKIYDLLKGKGIFYISTTVHVIAEEGFFSKEDYEKKSLRFRKKWTEKELLEILERSGFGIIKKIYTSERALGKEWITLILEKNV